MMSEHAPARGTALRLAAMRLAGMWRRRVWQTLALIVALAAAISYLGALGGYISTTQAGLTRRAAASTIVDWQIQRAATGDQASVRAAMQALPDVRALDAIGYVRIAGLSSATSAGVRTTAGAYLVSLPEHYLRDFPGQLRVLLGRSSGLVLAQQTASNLAATLGSSIIINTGKLSSHVTVTGVVDFAGADSFFQTVGVSAGAGPSAPPDNIVITDPATFRHLSVGLDSIQQWHVSFHHAWLPADPGHAVSVLDARRHHLEAALAGNGLVADNLAASLSAAREDALYGQLLFLLLGLPAFAAAIAVLVLSLGVQAQRRSSELALWSLRGANAGTIAIINLVEASATTAAGALAALPLTVLAQRWAFGSGHLSWGWWALAVVIVAAAVSIRLSVRPGSADDQRAGIYVSAASPRSRWWMRAYLDFILLAIAALVYWLAARSGYHVVLAPEGIASSSVNWASLLAPACLWPGLLLLSWRASAVAMRRLPLAAGREGGELILAGLRRRSHSLARSSAVLAMAVAAIASTAIFSATYRAQSRLDVALTVGADVAVHPAGADVDTRGARPGDPSSPAALAAGVAVIGRAPGVGHLSVQMHRYAYVGADLQDLFGVDPASIAAASPLRDQFVPGMHIATVLRALVAHPDGVLLSAETLHDYQLHPGDQIRLRLHNPAGVYQAWTFRVVGQVSEWPTAPKDSFIVANQQYLQRLTGVTGTPYVLASSRSPAVTAAWLRSQLPSSLVIDDVSAARAHVATASGLAATDLGGLARLQLGYGLAFALAGFNIAMIVATLQRRRALLVLQALGARRSQLTRFIAVEARAVFATGILAATGISAVVSWMLVKVLTGIFDPPPQHLSMPWHYLAIMTCALTASVWLIVVALSRLIAGRGSLAQMREL